MMSAMARGFRIARFLWRLAGVYSALRLERCCIMVNHMVNYQNTEILDATFKALSDPTRRAILERLTGGGTTVTDLARPFDVSLPAISRHLRGPGARGAGHAAPEWSRASHGARCRAAA